MRCYRRIQGIHPTPKPLAACLAAALSIGSAGATPGPSPSKSPAQVPAAITWQVDNCDDSGPGSVRDIIEAHAGSGDSVDLTQLTCSTITLTSGGILVSQDDLDLKGPGAAELTISGGNQQRVFVHAGSGTFGIKDLGIKFGYHTGAHGGCVESYGNVSAERTVFGNCFVRGNLESFASGGAIHTRGDLSLVQSTVSTNVVTNGHSGSSSTTRGGGVHVEGDLFVDRSVISGNLSASTYAAGFGGGIFVDGALTMTYSTVAGNSATSLSHVYSSGGGVWSEGPFVISHSAIVDNEARRSGAMSSLGSLASEDRIIANSTISSNQSVLTPAGIYMIAPLTLANSTVAFNAASQADSDLDAGIRAVLGIDMHSSIVSNNTAAGTPGDVLAPITGAGNLIFEPGNSALPAGTLVGENPLLGSLANHGGPTPIHSLLAGSPALEAGNNAFGDTTDQRGPGFARVVGGSADIGAFEYVPPLLDVVPGALDFGNVAQGEISPALTVTLSNEGGDTLHVDAIEAANVPFSRSGGSCDAAPMSLAPGQSCTLDFVFAPISNGPAAQMLSIESDGGDGEIALQGVGTQPILEVTPDIVDFGNTTVGGTPVIRSVTLGNAGTGTLEITAIDPATEPFAGSGGTCGPTPIELAADETCTVEYSFSPTATGTAVQNIGIDSDAGSADFTLIGLGVQGELSIAPTLLDFGAIGVDDTSPPLEVTLSNTGTAPFVIDSIATAKVPFERAGGTCDAPPFELATGESCTFGYIFSPGTTGPATQDIDITSDAGNGAFTLLGIGSAGDRVFADGFDS